MAANVFDLSTSTPTGERDKIRVDETTEWVLRSELFYSQLTQIRELSTGLEGSTGTDPEEPVRVIGRIVAVACEDAEDAENVLLDMYLKDRVSLSQLRGLSEFMSKWAEDISDPEA
jgi:hypothetical protein